MADPRAEIVTRRTLARGAAWTVPVIALAAAAPASAASGTCTVARVAGGISDSEVSATGVSCWVGVSLLAWPVCSGSATAVQATFTFALPDAYSSWSSTDMRPNSGQGSGPFQVVGIGPGPLEISGDGFDCHFVARRNPGRDTAPITFTLSVPGAPAVQLTAFE